MSMARYSVTEHGEAWRVTRESDGSLVGEYRSLPEAISAALAVEPDVPAEVVVHGPRERRVTDGERARSRG